MRERYSRRNSICRSLIMCFSVARTSPVWPRPLHAAETSSAAIEKLYHILTLRSRDQLIRIAVAQVIVDLIAGQLPIVIKVGDHVVHERIGHGDGTFFIAQVVEQDGQRQLPRTGPIVGPFEAALGKLL